MIPRKSSIYRIDEPQEVILQIQHALLEIAYQDERIPKIVPTGYFDEFTKEAIIAFQMSVHLPQSGEVNYETWTRLFEAYRLVKREKEDTIFLEKEAFEMHLGDTGYPIIVLQSQLGEFAKIYPNVVRPALTGQFGLTTAEAVRAIQRNYGLYADGVVDAQMWNRMQRDYRAQKELRRFHALHA